MFRNLKIRAFEMKDGKMLETWRDGFEDANLELPHGFVGKATETAVAEKDEKPLCSLTGTLAIVLDPLIRNPEARAMDLLPAIIQLARALEYHGTVWGATDAYIAVPESLPQFQKIVERCGYQETVQHCKIYRRPLTDLKSVEPVSSVEEDEEEAKVHANHD